MLIVRLLMVAAVFVAANALTLVAPSSLAAVRVGGEAYGLAVGNPAVGTPGAAYVQIPPEGGSVSDTSPGAGSGVGNAIGSTTQITTSSIGDVGPGVVTSTTTVADGELLSGLVRARDVRVVAATSGGHPSATVTFGSLIVAGIAYQNPEPNTRVELPGVGFAILNEQLVGGDGRDVGAIIARAVRIQITESSLFELPHGADIILAHAAAGVPDVIATRPVMGGPEPTATPVPWDPISAYVPIDVSLGNHNGDTDNFTIGNGNFNDNGTGTGVPGAIPGGTPPGIVITVVVVQCPPIEVPGSPTPPLPQTPTPTATVAGCP